ncbi:MAG: polymer-forming cytoskeletal protein [Acidobacteria bacterium]|nr:MAG: polymer-forming cytoskeletal protein [Acidobacteriota bacterium]
MWKKNDTQYPQQPEPVHQPSVPIHNPSPVEQLRERAIIGSSILIKGDVSGEEDLVVQGQVEGRIELRQHNVTVGKNGRVKADIWGKIISVEGEVIGNIYGEEKIVIRSSGVLHGNITAPRVTLEDGSKFKGSIDMDSRQAEKAAVPVVRESKPEGELLRKTQLESHVEPKKEEEFKKASMPYKPNVAAPRT